MVRDRSNDEIIQKSKRGILDGTCSVTKQLFKQWTTNYASLALPYACSAYGTENYRRMKLPLP
jgi:hypothetical protein